MNLRTNFSQNKIDRHVHNIALALGLKRCFGQKIGDQFIRGVSGGERKRTAIAMELALNPDLLFLDEPTTGLDATTAYKVIHLLKQLSKSKTIIMSIHQPRSSIWELFDRIVLMYKGKIL